MKGVVGGVGGRLLTTIVGTVAISLGSHSSFAATRFVDLTAKEYKGADSDLAGFYLNHLGVNCPEGDIDLVGQPDYVSWDNPPSRVRKGSHSSVRLYKINFRIKDRGAQVVHQEGFDYDESIPNNKSGYVIHDSLTGCDRNVVKFSKGIDLTFATVEYWVSKVEWAKADLRQPESEMVQAMPEKVKEIAEPNNVAFTVNDVAQSYQKTKRELAESEKNLIVSYTQPASSFAEINLDSRSKAYILDKVKYSSKIHTDSKWNAALKSACAKNHDCPVEALPMATSGENISDADTDERCEKFGCIVLITAPKDTSKDEEDGYSACIQAKQDIRVESCAANSEDCHETAIWCDRMRPASYGKKIQIGSEELSVMTWHPKNLRDAKKVRIVFQGKTFEILSIKE